MGVIKVNPTEGKRRIERLNRRLASTARDYGTDSYIYKEMMNAIKAAYGDEAIKTTKKGVVYVANTRRNQAIADTDVWTRLRTEASQWVEVDGKHQWVNEYWDKRMAGILKAFSEWSGQDLAGMSKKARTEAIRTYMSQISIIDEEIESLLSEYYQLTGDSERAWIKGFGYSEHRSTLPEKLKLIEQLQSDIAYRRQLQGDSFQDVLKELQLLAKQHNVEFGNVQRLQPDLTGG